MNIKKADVIEMRLELPGDHWQRYYVLERYADGHSRWSSIPPSQVQHPAEHFTLSETEIDELIREGRVRLGGNREL